MNSSSPDSPYKVPPFSVKADIRPTKYFWYSWHPLYPYWSRSCWSYDSVELAMVGLADEAKGLSLYHNKLVRDENGTLTEVADAPCERMDIWLKIKDNEKKGLYEGRIPKLPPDPPSIGRDCSP